MACDACCSTCARLNSAVSLAKSASTIRDLAADAFSDTFDRFDIVKSSRLFTAPNSDRIQFIVSKALSMTPMACWALSAVSTLIDANERPNDPSPRVFDSLKPVRD